MKAFIAILLIAAAALSAALIWRHKQAVQQKEKDETQISSLSNQIQTTQSKLDEQERISMYLQTNLHLTVSNLITKSNEAARISVDLLRAQAEAKANADAYAAAKMESDKRQAEIDKLNGTITDQTKKLTDLDTAIAGLSKQITETERKLAASEGDREFLLKELKRLQTEKTELERQFNDLAALRAQVSRLKEDLSVARRLQWIRDGLYGAAERKGAEQLLLGTVPTPDQQRPGVDLNVTIRQDGGVKVNTNTLPKTP